MVSNKGSTPYATQKTHEKLMAKIVVAGKHLNLGVRGQGKKPSWRWKRSSGTGVATLGRSRDQSPRAGPIFLRH